MQCCYHPHTSGNIGMDTVLITLIIIASIVAFVGMIILTVLVCLKCRDIIKRRSRMRGQFRNRNHRRRIQVEMVGGGNFTIDDTIFDPPPPYSEVNNNNRTPPPPYTPGDYIAPLAAHRPIPTRPIARLTQVTRIDGHTGTTRIEGRTEMGTTLTQTASSGPSPRRGLVTTTIGIGDTAPPDSARTVTNVEFV